MADSINIHVMHSMKGGCGKSACALFKVLQLAKEKTDLSQGENAKVILVDADFSGSALQHLLFYHEDTESYKYSTLLEKHKDDIGKATGLKHTLAIPDEYDQHKNLNRYLCGKYKTFEEIVLHSFSYQDLSASVEAGVTDSHLGINGYVDFVLSSSETEDKKLFAGGSREALAIGIYKYHMSCFLRQIIRHGIPAGNKLGQYSDIVIDMPPGYDEYSDLLLEELYELAQNNDSIKLNYYAVTTNDLGHIYLTINNIEAQMNIDSRYHKWNSMNVILNEMKEGDFAVSDKKMKNINNEILKLYSDLHARGNLFLQRYEKTYNEFCRSHSIKNFGCQLKFAKMQVDNKDDLIVMS